MGSAPGVIVGAVLRVYVADDPMVFNLVAAAVLLPTGLFILSFDSTPENQGPAPETRWARGRLLSPPSLWELWVASMGSEAGQSGSSQSRV